MGCTHPLCVPEKLRISTVKSKAGCLYLLSRLPKLPSLPLCFPETLHLYGEI